jgi:hypothetical protein
MGDAVPEPILSVGLTAVWRKALQMARTLVMKNNGPAKTAAIG